MVRTTGIYYPAKTKDVTAYFTSDQVQPFRLCRYCRRCVGFAGDNPMPILLSSVVFVLSLLVVRTTPANDRMPMSIKAKSFFRKQCSVDGLFKAKRH